jgi:hypothetical protein
MRMHYFSEGCLDQLVSTALSGCRCNGSTYVVACYGAVASITAAHHTADRRQKFLPPFRFRAKHRRRASIGCRSGHRAHRVCTARRNRRCRTQVQARRRLSTPCDRVDRRGNSQRIARFTAARRQRPGGQSRYRQRRASCHGISAAFQAQLGADARASMGNLCARSQQHPSGVR